MSRSAVILHNAVPPDASAADADVLVQVRVVREALEQLEWEVRELPATLDLSAVERELTANRPDLVFNLVESLGGRDRLASLAADLLEGLGIPFTGCSSNALRSSNSKVETKEKLVAAVLPTPRWLPEALNDANQEEEVEWIIKPIFEHASLGMNDDAIVSGTPAEALGLMLDRSDEQHRPYFAEAFIRGREFNLSLLEQGYECLVLPPAEIIFRDYPPDKPRIIGEAAKWNETSFEYQNTPRTFDISAHDWQLLQQLRLLAQQCWRHFDLEGYARVDFRVDEQGQPWILEINTNPCLSPDGGFAAALERADISFVDAIAMIVESTEGGETSTKQMQRVERNLSSKHLPLREPEATRAAVFDPLQVAKSFLAWDAKSGPVLRREVRHSDIDDVRRIVTSTDMFRPAEIDVAAELVQARLSRGEESGYEFVFIEVEGSTVGYVCFGRNTLTVSSWDLYWIAVENDHRGRGLGWWLLRAVEGYVESNSGTRIYIETSHRPDYEPTRKFYEKHGYVLQAMLPDYYAPGDGRAIFVKSLS